MKKTRAREVDKRGFLEHIAAGKSWIGGSFSDDLQTLDSWQLAALDFDNDTEVSNADGKKVKRFLRPGEDGFISPFDALERCESFGIAPLVIYKTLNCSKDNTRFRMVFDFTETTNEIDVARAVIVTLQDLFPESDPKCLNPNRIYLGTNQAVWAVCEAWFI